MTAPHTLEGAVAVTPVLSRSSRGVSQSIEELEPLDDIGSETLARFRFQVELTVQHCLATITEAGADRVICELHEDYIFYAAQRPPCLVSVKHLEDSQPRWTNHGLLDAGGVAHLFERWRASPEPVSCLLRTNCGLRTGHDEPAGLQECCASNDTARLGTWAGTLAPILNSLLPNDAMAAADEVLDFLSVLRLEDGLPGRADVRSHNLVSLMPEVLIALGVHADRAEEVYDLIAQEVERACRNEDGRSVLEMLADPDRLDANSQLARTIAAKTIDRKRLLDAIDRQQREHNTSIRVHTTPAASALRLKAKLERGGFGPTAVSRARNLRFHWELHRQRWSSELPVHGDRFEEAKAIVLSAADAAETATRALKSEPYGLAMLEALRTELTARNIRVPGSDPAEVDLLLGCAFDLTDECHVWWSDEFDVDGSQP